MKAPVRAHDGRSLLVEFELRGNGDTADTRVQPVLDAVATLQHAHPAFTVAEFGDASANHALNESVGKDFSQAEKLSLPITFLILLLAFGAFVAAGVPVLLAFSAVLASIGLSSARQPRRARVRRDELGDPADRDGGRRRLLALLREARARGARRGARRATRRCSARRRRRAWRSSSRARPC